MLKIGCNHILLDALLLAVCSGCFSRGDTTTSDGAAGVILPVKNAITPNGSIYNLNSISSNTPSDTFYSLQTALFNALRAPKAWNRSTDCSDIKIGVVDSGVYSAHEDLSANLLSGGKNFTVTPSTTDISDQNGHGTHVSGIIAAVGNNNKGVSGVCWNAQVMMAKVTDAQGSAYLSDVVDGMDYLLDQGASVINASLGSYVAATTESENASFEDVFSGVTAKAESNGALIVAASGNNGSNTDINRTYPASLISSSIISVAANNEGHASDGLFASSNYGGGTVHLSAPGVTIYSTLPATGSAPNGAYGDKSGTSMAAPMVTGTLALMWHCIGKTQINSAQLKSLLLNNVESHSGAAGTPGSYLLTGGHLDVGAAIEASRDFIGGAACN